MKTNIERKLQNQKVSKRVSTFDPEVEQDDCDFSPKSNNLVDRSAGSSNELIIDYPEYEDI